MINAPPFPYKFNDKFDIQNPLKKFIEAYHGANAYKPIHQVLVSIQKLRNSLVFFNLAGKMKNNPSMMQKVENDVILYLRYIYLLEGRFKFDNYSPKHVIIDVKWSGSFNRKALISKALKFEISCMLYNLVLIYLNNGAYYLNTSKDDS